MGCGGSRCPACMQELVADSAALRAHVSQCPAVQEQASAEGQVLAEGQEHSAEDLLQTGYDLARQSYAPAAVQASDAPTTAGMPTPSTMCPPHKIYMFIPCSKQEVRSAFGGFQVQHTHTLTHCVRAYNHWRLCSWNLSVGNSSWAFWTGHSSYPRRMIELACYTEPE